MSDLNKKTTGVIIIASAAWDDEPSIAKKKTSQYDRYKYKPEPKFEGIEYFNYKKHKNWLF